MWSIHGDGGAFVVEVIVFLLCGARIDDDAIVVVGMRNERG